MLKNCLNREMFAILSYVKIVGKLAWKIELDEKLAELDEKINLRYFKNRQRLTLTTYYT